jgi:hypothetical protein
VTDLDERDQLADELRAAQEMNLALEESLVDAQLALDDRGWRAIRDDGRGSFTREGLLAASGTARVMAVVNPLIRRGLALRTSYVWGQGVAVVARQEDEGEQDVNAIVQAFLDDESNQAALTSGTAREQKERALGTDGNVFLALFTTPTTGRVVVRSFPLDEIDDVITNPDDRDEPWFYKRTYTTTQVAPAAGGARTSEQTRTVYYPALGYRPNRRPRQVDGNDVQWDAPVLHVKVNALDGWKFGVGDAYAALFWARAYKEFLEDWARLVKALSRFAWQATARTGRGRAAVRKGFASGVVDPTTGATREVGAAAVTSEDVTLQAIPKTGATIDSESGRPLASMTAAALDVPVTMLLGDPGVTGARAVADTLDLPTELAMSMRRSLWTAIYRRILGYVIDQAVKAPRGQLRGAVRIDPFTQREVITLAGDQDRTIDVDWPDYDTADVGQLVKAVAEADATGKMPPEVTLELLLQALGVEDVDEILAKYTDEEGNFVIPEDASAARSQQDAVARGDVPPADGGPTPDQPPGDQPTP